MKAAKEVAMLSVVKSSHMCLLGWRGEQQLEECVKGKENRAGPLLEQAFPDETKRGAGDLRATL